MTESKLERTVKVEVLHMGWLNVYAPFYLAMCTLEKFCPFSNNKLCRFPDEEVAACRNCQLRFMDSKGGKGSDSATLSKNISTGANSNKANIRWICSYEIKDTDEKIIEALYDSSLDDGIFRVGLCDPTFIYENDKYKEKLETAPFISRLPLYGFSDIDSLEKLLPEIKMEESLIRHFSQSTNDRFRQIITKLKEHKNAGNAELLLKAYTYPKGTTVYKLLAEGLQFPGREEINPIFVDLWKENKPVEIVNRKIDDKINISDIFEPMHNNSSDDKPAWITFTVEPAGPYRPDRQLKDILPRLELIYSSVPQLADFSTLIWRKGAPVEQTTLLTETLQKSVELFYGEEYFKDAEKDDDNKASRAVDFHYEYREWQKDCEKRKEGRADSKSDSDVVAKNKELDLLEWEIFRNQRIYAFDITEEAKKWQNEFTKLAGEIGNHEMYSSLANNNFNSIYDNIKEKRNTSGDPSLDYTVNYFLDALSDLAQKRQVYSIKAACAAIMARNMSHNLGSHVLNYLKKLMKDLGECLNLEGEFEMNQNQIEEIVEGDIPQNKKTFLDTYLHDFLTYLNRRMEFIATIATASPGSPTSLNVYRDIFSFLDGNKYLKEYIAKSEFEHDDQGKVKDKLEFIFKRNGQALKNTDTDPKEEYKRMFQTLQVAVPDGVIGVQAFCTIIENFIRNSAKHSYAKAKDNEDIKDDTLKITIDIRDDEKNWRNDYFKVAVSNNCQDKDVAQKKFNEKDDLFSGDKYPYVNPVFVDNRGQLIYKYWGIKEMFICASYLRGRRTEEYNEPVGENDPPILELTEEKENLAYSFYLFKPKTLLIVKDRKDEHQETNPEKLIDDFVGRFSSEGVDRIDFKKLEDRAFFVRHDFVLLHECFNNDNQEALCLCHTRHEMSKPETESASWIMRNQNMLPFRVFCSCDKYKAGVTWAEWEDEWFKKTDFHELYGTLYENWLCSFYKIEEIPLLCIVDDSPKTQTLWNHYGRKSEVVTSGTVAGIERSIKGKSAVFFVYHLTSDSADLEIIKNIGTKKIYVNSISGGDSTGRFIRELDESELKQMRLHLIETSLASVRIIDERIFNNCSEEQHKFYAQCDVRVYNYSAKDKSIIPKIGDPKDVNNWRCPTKWNFLKQDGEKSNFLVIHRGIVEKILINDNQQEFNRLLSALKQSARYIFLDSGRGKPEYIDKSHFVRYVNLENLYQWFFDSKVSLVGGLLTIINRKTFLDDSNASQQSGRGGK